MEANTIIYYNNIIIILNNSMISLPSSSIFHWYVLEQLCYWQVWILSLSDYYSGYSTWLFCLVSIHKHTNYMVIEIIQ